MTTRIQRLARIIPWVLLAILVASMIFELLQASSVRAATFGPSERVRGDDIGPESDGVTLNQANGGARNVVTVVNRTDGRLRVRGNIQTDRMNGAAASPVNIALAYSSCVNCQSISVALQIAFRTPDAQIVAPQNAALAFNVGCTYCHSLAIAFQYVYAVEAPTDVPEEAQSLIREMDRELQIIHSDQRIGLQEAEARVVGVVNRFNEVAESIYVQRQEKDENVQDEPVTTVPDAVVLPTPTATPGLSDATPTPSPALDVVNVTPTPTPSLVSQEPSTPTATATPGGADPAIGNTSATVTATATSTPSGSPAP